MTRKVISATLLVTLILMCQVAWASSMLGWVVTENNALIIIRADGTQVPCQQYAELYEGDVIQGEGADLLAIQWYLPAAGKESTANGVRVTLKRPGFFQSLVADVKDFLGLTEEARVALGLNTRSTKQKLPSEAYLYPGYYATVALDEKVKLTWGRSDAEELTIKDNTGNVVYNTKVSGVTAIELQPDKVGLRDGEVYQWMVDEIAGPYSLKVLSEDAAAILRRDLVALDKGANPYEKSLKKAAYVRMLSDSYPDDFDLYWLSDRYARAAFGSADEKLNKRAVYFIECYKLHLNEQERRSNACTREGGK